MSGQTGLDWLLYLNTGDNETPVWTLIKRVRDVSPDFTKDMADVSSRASRWKRYVGSLKDGPLDVAYVYRQGVDAALTAILDSYVNDTHLQLACVDQDIDEEGAFGFKAWFICSGFPIKQPLADGVVLDLKFALADHVEEVTEGEVTSLVEIEPDFIGFTAPSEEEPDPET